MKKALFINGSPRKKWNTVKMLESAMKGAFSEEDKRKYRDEHFATDLQNAYEPASVWLAIARKFDNRGLS